MKLQSLVPVLAVLLAACASDSSADGQRSPSANENAVLVSDLPWTEDFMESAVLVADEIRIEGPPGLLEHFAQRQDAEVHSYRARTVPEGFLQETTVSAVGPTSAIRCHLDNLTMVVERRLTVLERPGEVAVRVVARGDAYWKRTNSENERRGERLELIGHRPQ